ADAFGNPGGPGMGRVAVPVAGRSRITPLRHRASRHHCAFRPVSASQPGSGQGKYGRGGRVSPQRQPLRAIGPGQRERELDRDGKGGAASTGAADPGGRRWLKSYPEGVPAEIGRLPYASVAELILASCRKFAGRTAFTSFGRRLTYAELDRLSAGLA